MNSRFVWLAAGIVVVASLLRIGGACNGLWLDEIWSLKLAREVSSPVKVFTALHHDNNHYLNTVWLHLTRMSESPAIHRLPSVLAGIGSIVMAGVIALRRGRAAASLTIMLVGFSYILILYSSEARGYSLAVFFALLAYYFFLRFRETRGWLLACGFVACTVLGLASHLTFISFIGATLSCSIYRLASSRATRPQFLVEVFALHATPSAFFAFLYLADIRHLAEGGGSSTSLVVSFGSALAWMVGTFSSFPAELISAVVALAGLVVGMREYNHEEKIFFLCMVFVFPILLALMRGSTTIYPRYFLLSIVFAEIVFGRALASIFRRGRAGVISCAAAITVYSVVNGANIARLWEFGRGDLHGAVRFIVRTASRPGHVTVCGSQDFRILQVLAFYGPRVAPAQTIQYFKHGFWPDLGAEFLIASREANDPPTPQASHVRDERGNEYRFEKAFPTAPLSGMHWFLYRNARFPARSL